MSNILVLPHIQAGDYPGLSAIVAGLWSSWNEWRDADLAWRRAAQDEGLQVVAATVRPDELRKWQHDKGFDSLGWDDVMMFALACRRRQRRRSMLGRRLALVGMG